MLLPIANYGGIDFKGSSMRLNVASPRLRCRLLLLLYLLLIRAIIINLSLVCAFKLDIYLLDRRFSFFFLLCAASC
jgi:hypothetical protein